MNILVIIKLAVSTCFTIIADGQDSYGRFETALNSVENQIQIEQIDFYHTPFAVNSQVVEGAVYEINGVVFSCH